MFSRREFLKGATLSALLPFVSGGEVSLVDRPNILIIVSDDQPFYTAGPKPDGGYWMPKLHANMRVNGLEFQRAYVPVPICAPSRTSFLTGKNLHNHGISDNYRAATKFRKHGYGATSLGAYLGEWGYECLYSGKFINGYEAVASWVPRGYSRWASSLQKTDPIRANIEGTVRRPREGVSFIRPKEETSWLTDKALRFISETPEGTPWFCMAAVTAPHDPYTPSDAHAGSFANVSMPIRPNFDAHDPNKPGFISNTPPLTNSEKASIQDQWRGKMEELMDLDDAIERLLQAVDMENTYVFFFTDNGFMLGEHRLIYKAKPYEEATRTPLLVRGPGVRQNASTNLLASTIDISATILDLAGLEPEDLAYEMDGRSLVGPMFEPDETQLEWRTNLLMEETGVKGHSQDSNWHALRTSGADEYLYVEHDTGAVELYDMASDPDQLTNIAHEADLLPLAQKLDEMQGASGDTLRAAELS